jgi:CheY-like chemotaxis protein
MNPTQSSQSSILVVDDEPAVLGEIASVLTAAGFVCNCCTTADMAIARARVAPPDLILSDIHLHERSGLEMCEQIRQIEALRDVPVMFLSRTQTPDIIRRRHAAGGAYYLRKPFDPEVLVELIHKVLWMPQLVASRTGRPQMASV